MLTNGALKSGFFRIFFLFLSPESFTSRPKITDLAGGYLVRKIIHAVVAICSRNIGLFWNYATQALRRSSAGSEALDELAAGETVFSAALAVSAFLAIGAECHVASS